MVDRCLDDLVEFFFGGRASLLASLLLSVGLVVKLCLVGGSVVD